MSIFSSLPAVILLLAVIGFFIFTGVRLGIAFLVRRLAGLVFVLVSVLSITYVLSYYAPVDAIATQLGNKFTPDAYNRLKAHYHLDLGFWERFGYFANNLIHFNLGESYLQRGQNVGDIIARQLPASLMLGGIATIFAVTTGVVLGVIAAVRANTRYDTGAQILALFFFAVPTFAIVPFYRLAMIQLGNWGLPALPVTSTEFGFAHPDQLIAPILVFSIIQLAFYTRLTRTSLLEVLRQDYVRTARAKGLTSRQVLWGHAFRNSMIPLITAIGPALAFIVNGAFITESLFNIQGIGQQTLSAIQDGDTPVLFATVILLAVAVALMTLVTDVLYGLVDPRIKTA
jgi:ABC-type dipeptide/oligopeptide/nickel transport system permease component